MLGGGVEVVELGAEVDEVGDGGEMEVLWRNMLAMEYKTIHDIERDDVTYCLGRRRPCIAPRRYRGIGRPESAC